MKKFRIPNQITIGNTKYKINLVENIDEDILEKLSNFLNNSRITGQINLTSKLILISKISSDKKNTFFHEVAHGIIGEMEKRYDVEEIRNDEKFIDKMAIILEKTFNSLEKEQKMTKNNKIQRKTPLRNK